MFWSAEPSVAVEPSFVTVTVVAPSCLAFSSATNFIVSVNSFLHFLEGFIVLNLFCSRFFKCLDLLVLVLFNLRLRLFQFVVVVSVPLSTD